MGCLILIVAVLAIVVFWKQIVEIILVSAGVAFCYAIPACRDNILPLIRSWGDALFSNPVKTLTLSTVAILAVFALSSYTVNALYKKLAPANLKSQFPTWREFKCELKRIWRDY